MNVDSAEDRNRFAQLMAGLAAAYNVELTKERAEIYFRALADLAVADVGQAVAIAVQRSKFFPSVAELREYAGAGVPDVGVVEAKLVEHLSRCGGLPKAPADPFLALVFQRLGGVRAALDMPSGVRLRSLEKLLPGVIASCAARQIAIPTERGLLQLGGPTS